MKPPLQFIHLDSRTVKPRSSKPPIQPKMDPPLSLPTLSELRKTFLNTTPSSSNEIYPLQPTEIYPLQPTDSCDCPVEGIDCSLALPPPPPTSPPSLLSHNFSHVSHMEDSHMEEKVIDDQRWKVKASFVFPSMPSPSSPPPLLLEVGKDPRPYPEPSSLISISSDEHQTTTTQPTSPSELQITPPRGKGGLVLSLLISAGAALLVAIAVERSLPCFVRGRRRKLELARRKISCLEISIE